MLGADVRPAASIVRAMGALVILSAGDVAFMSPDGVHALPPGGEEG